MRVLMVAPHPVYSPRGTPISVFNRCLALCALGHEVDLVTYPVGRGPPGRRPALPAGRRARRPLGRRGAVGAQAGAQRGGDPAVVKEAARGRGRYDVVHTHEEAGLFGPALAAMAGVPHVYDMGNDWSDVLCNYGLRPANPITRLAGALERAVIRHSDASSPTSRSSPTGWPPPPALRWRRSSTSRSTPIPDPEVASAIRRSWAPEGSKVILYSGTLEPYQGVQLLLESMTDVARTHPHAVLVVVGGQEEQVEALRHRAEELGISDTVRLVGMLPATLVPACMMAADVLVSPRERGRNTPLKIFSYLRSGRPIVATDIVSHTQVLTTHSAALGATERRRPGPGHPSLLGRRPDPYPAGRGCAPAPGRVRH